MTEYLDNSVHAKAHRAVDDIRAAAGTIGILGGGGVLIGDIIANGEDKPVPGLVKGLVLLGLGLGLQSVRPWNRRTLHQGYFADSPGAQTFNGGAE